MEDVEADVDPDAVDQKPTVTLADYLENVSLLSNVDVADDETNNKVALMTVHTAKGLEFPYVFVAGMEENLFPSGGWMLTPQDLEEERRLFYVAITRAKKAVFLSFAETRMRNGKHESNGPSRFLRELAPQYLDKPLRKESFEPWESDGFSVTWEGKTNLSPFPGAGRMAGRGGQISRNIGPNFSDGKSVPSSGPASEPINRPVIPEKPAVIDPNFVPEPMTSFKVGDRIEHNRFGAGKVLEIYGQVPDLKAKIAFDQYGEKLLILKFAKLRHI